MESKKIEVIVIENDNVVVHRSTSQVYPDSNTYNVVIQAMVNELTDLAGRTPVKVQPIEHQRPAVAIPAPVQAQIQVQEDNKFHPDLASMGVTKNVKQEKYNIQSIKPIKMNEVLNGGN